LALTIYCKKKSVKLPIISECSDGASEKFPKGKV